MSSMSAPSASGSIASRRAVVGSSIWARFASASCHWIIGLYLEGSEGCAAVLRLFDDDACPARESPGAPDARGDGDTEGVAVLDNANDKHAAVSLDDLVCLG